MKVSIDYKGRVKGMDKVLTAAMEEFVGLDYEKTDEACTEFGRLAREIAELAWICRISAGKRHYFGYEFEVFVTAAGLRWQRYRTAAAPPLPLPSLAAHLINRHNPAMIFAANCQSRIVAIASA